MLVWNSRSLKMPWTCTRLSRKFSESSGDRRGLELESSLLLRSGALVMYGSELFWTWDVVVTVQMFFDFLLVRPSYSQQDLNMTDNPLGALGMRSLLRLLSRQQNALKHFQSDGCYLSCTGHDGSIGQATPCSQTNWKAPEILWGVKLAEWYSKIKMPTQH